MMLSIFMFVAALQHASEDLDPWRLPLGEPPTRLEPGSIADQYQRPAALLLGRALIANRGMEVLSVLCDEIGPRLTGSENAERAIAWCQERMRADGFENVRAEPVLVPHWERGHCAVQLTAPLEEALAACALGGSIGTPDGPLEGPVVVVSGFEELRRIGEEGVAGRIVLFNGKMTRNGGSMSGYGRTAALRTQGAVEAAKRGAVASITRSVGTDRGRLPHTGAMRYEEGVPEIPAVAIAGEDADRIQRLVDRGLEVRLTMDLGCQTHPDKMSANVVAEIVGREKPEEIVLIGGHLDSWDLGTGALDDGAGCAIAWEAARLLRELDLIPRRTIRVVLFMNEENGLRGGTNYAALHRDEADRHVAAIESDSGAGRPIGWSGGSNEAIVEAVESIAALLRGIGADSVQAGGAGGADISPLFRLGVPCFGLRQDTTYYFDYHHTPADTLDKVGPFELSLNIGALAVMAYVLADMEQPLHELGH